MYDSILGSTTHFDSSSRTKHSSVSSVTPFRRLASTVPTWKVSGWTGLRYLDVHLIVRFIQNPRVIIGYDREIIHRKLQRITLIHLFCPLLPDTPNSQQQRALPFCHKQGIWGSLVVCSVGWWSHRRAVAPLSRACFCCLVIQGYALTETCVVGCFQSLEATSCGIVGPTGPCIEK
jgi:hypothetical protein